MFNFGRFLGIFVGIGAMITALFLENAHLQTYYNTAAIIIILGGCSGAVIIANGGSNFLKVPLYFFRAFTNPKILDIEATAQILKNIAIIIRKEGHVSASATIQSISHPFLKEGLQLVTDGMPADEINKTLHAYLRNFYREQKAGIDIFNNLGGFAPTMGIIGTVIGLVNMMVNLGKLGSDGLGGAIAVAFIATLYGIGFANLIFLPTANALKEKLETELNFNKALIEAIVLIQEGGIPRAVERKFLDNALKAY